MEDGGRVESDDAMRYASLRARTGTNPAGQGLAQLRRTVGSKMAGLSG